MSYVLPTPPGSSLCGHTVSSGLSGLSVCLSSRLWSLRLLSRSLLSPYVTCLPSFLWGTKFLSRASWRGPFCRITGYSRILFSEFQYTNNTGKVPANHDFSADRSIVGVTWKTNKLSYICLGPVCQFINPLSFSTLRKQCSGLDSPYSFKQASLYLVYLLHSV